MTEYYSINTIYFNDSFDIRSVYIDADETYNLNTSHIHKLEKIWNMLKLEECICIKSFTINNLKNEEILLSLLEFINENFYISTLEISNCNISKKTTNILTKIFCNIKIFSSFNYHFENFLQDELIECISDSKTLEKIYITPHPILFTSIISIVTNNTNIIEFYYKRHYLTIEQNEIIDKQIEINKENKKIKESTLVIRCTNLIPQSILNEFKKQVQF